MGLGDSCTGEEEGLDVYQSLGEAVRGHGRSESRVDGRIVRSIASQELVRR